MKYYHLSVVVLLMLYISLFIFSWWNFNKEYEKIKIIFYFPDGYTMDEPSAE